jgi:Bacterial Ig-like domain
MTMINRTPLTARVAGWASTALLAVLLGACGTPADPDPTPPPPPNAASPRLVSSVPAADAVSVPVTSDLVLDFSEPMNPSATRVTSSPRAEVTPGVWSRDNSRWVVSAPHNGWASGTRYELSIVGQDSTGTPLPETKRAFTTATVTLPAQHPRVLLSDSSIKAGLQAKLSSAHPSATRFKALVDRAVGPDPANLNDGEADYGYEGWFGALLGALTNEARYCTDAVARGEAWLEAENARVVTYLGLSEADRARTVPTAVSGDSYLEVGPIVGGLMLTYDFCHARLSDAQRLNWRNYAKQAVWNVWHHTQSHWGTAANAWKGQVTRSWSGWSVDDPLNNYYYSFLQATMYLALATHGEDPDTVQYLVFVRRTKLQEQLVPLFRDQLRGGGSREGTGYGTALKNLFHLYYVWQASTGERIADLTSHAFDTMAYQLHAIAPTKDRLAPIGDHARDSSAAFFDYHRELLLALNALYRGTSLAARVATELPGMIGEDGVQGRMRFSQNFIWDFLYEEPTPGTPMSLNTTYHALGTGHLFVRSSWNADATWLGFLAGPYSQSHAHKDGLSVLLYKRDWLMHDLNIGSSSGLEQGMDMHALVKLDGQDAVAGDGDERSARLTALRDRAAYTYLEANQGTLYRDANVRIARQILFFKPNVIVIHDTARLEGGNSTASFYAPLASSSLPVTTANTVSFTTEHGTRFKLFWLAQPGQTRSITPINGAHRLTVRSSSAGVHRFVNVFSLDDAVASVSTLDAPHKLRLALNDGRELNVTFRDDAGDAPSVRLGDGSLNDPLEANIDALPLER